MSCSDCELLDSTAILSDVFSTSAHDRFRETRRAMPSVGSPVRPSATAESASLTLRFLFQLDLPTATFSEFHQVRLFLGKSTNNYENELPLSEKSNRISLKNRFNDFNNYANLKEVSVLIVNEISSHSWASKGREEV